ncbi:MAG: hypothetical protein ACI9U2_003177 [Bradymonadia bacterium]|jgi:hypothetical protein
MAEDGAPHPSPELTMQSAQQRPDPSTQRKAAIVQAAAIDHSGSVHVAPIQDFDLDRTIFKTLEGGLSRFVTASRVGKDAAWKPAPAQQIATEYSALLTKKPLPDLDEALLAFLVDECDFDVEHADGSFLDHLYFCFEYCAQHFAAGSPLVMLLHSVLGTGTNTFAMTADKMPALKALVSDADWAQICAFPSLLRLLYDTPLGQELLEHSGRWDTLQSISMHRVIDNAPLTLTADQFFEGLNYQLMHLIDFLPVSNWAAHQNVPSFIVFRELYALMEHNGKRAFALNYTPASGPAKLVDEDAGLGSWLATKIPVGVSRKMTAKSLRRFSERAGHDISYSIVWG